MYCCWGEKKKTDLQVCDFCREVYFLEQSVDGCTQSTDLSRMQSPGDGRGGCRSEPLLDFLLHWLEICRSSDVLVGPWTFHRLKVLFFFLPDELKTHNHTKSGLGLLPPGGFRGDSPPVEVAFLIPPNILLVHWYPDEKCVVRAASAVWVPGQKKKTTILSNLVDWIWKLSSLSSLITIRLKNIIELHKYKTKKKKKKPWKRNKRKTTSLVVKKQSRKRLKKRKVIFIWYNEMKYA